MTGTAPPLETIKTDHPWTQHDEWPPGPYTAAYMVIGVFAGILSALFGIGSGVVIVPLLSGWFHVPLRRAVGISIVVVFGVVLAGVVSEAIATTNINWALAAVLALGAQVGVRLGGWLGPRVSSNVLRWVFVGMIAFTVLKLAQIIPGDATYGVFCETDLLTPWLFSVLGAGVFAGFLSVLLGIGGGIVAVPALLLLVEFQDAERSFQAARATSLAMILPTSFSGMLVHLRQKNVLWRSALPIMVPGFIGAIAGVALANFLPGDALKHYVFPVFLTIMGIRLVIKSK